MEDEEESVGRGSLALAIFLSKGEKGGRGWWAYTLDIDGYFLLEQFSAVRTIWVVGESNALGVYTAGAALHVVFVRDLKGGC